MDPCWAAPVLRGLGPIRLVHHRLEDALAVLLDVEHLVVQHSLACRFSKVWRGYPCNLWPWKQQNNEIPVENEGSEARIVKFLTENESSGSSCWAGKGISPGRNNCPAGLKYSGKRKVWAPRGPSPDPRDLCLVPAWSWDPKMRAGNLLAQPTGPNRTVPDM